MRVVNGECLVVRAIMSHARPPTRPEGSSHRLHDRPAPRGGQGGGARFLLGDAVLEDGTGGGVGQPVWRRA
jgi:hypothetical protein